MQFEFSPKITKSFLLSKHPEEYYLEHYLGIPVGKGMYCSPLRADPNPTCAFYKTERGNVIFKDFRGDFSGDFVKVVMYQNNCSYGKALDIIANDFGFISVKGLVPNTPKKEFTGNVLKETSQAKIQVEIQEFSQKELDWWASFGISKTALQRFKVFSCKHVFLNGNLHCTSTESSPVFGYFGGIKDGIEYWRIYCPTKRKYRFLSNWSSSMIQGAAQLKRIGDLVVVTKSLKDVMTLWECGIDAIAPCSESIFMTQAQLDRLRMRFSKIVVLYDNDLAGIKSMKKIKAKFGSTCVFIPRKYKVKDISDFMKKYGTIKTIEFVEKYAKVFKNV